MPKRSVVISLLVLLLAFSGARAESVWMAGGKSLTESDTTYLSPKLGHGAGGALPADATFRFVFGSTFPISKVLIRMEERKGNRILPGSRNAVTDLQIRHPAEDQEMGDGEIGYVIDAHVRTDPDPIRFGLCFVDRSGLVRLDGLRTQGRGVVARPVPAGAEGVLLPVTNSWDEKLCYFRGELHGTLPKIKGLEVSDLADGFHIEIAPDGRSFVLRGGALGAGREMEIRVLFAEPALERGTLVLGAAYV